MYLYTYTKTSTGSVITSYSSYGNNKVLGIVD